jgi:uncharacterized protein (TIGR00304 family)
MRPATLRSVGFALLIVGLLGTAWSVYSGLTRFFLVVVFPVFTSDSLFGLLPLLAIFAGIGLLALGPVFEEEGRETIQPEQYSDVEGRNNQPGGKFGGVVLIGPIPILFGSDKKTSLIVAALAIMILAIIVLFLL